jgi:NAD(P)-dependent dehydrogenase (short-subunit alcohol dehydrogenase family)
MSIEGKTVLITGAAVRIGRAMALAVANAGANVIIHYGFSEEQAITTQAEIKAKGVEAHIIQTNLKDPKNIPLLIEKAWEFGPLYALVNNASIFENLSFIETNGRIINILDWRALRPGADHFPYTISKAGLAALTQSLAVSLAPNITVNGIAFGAILPPSDGGDTGDILKDVPAKRWADMEEVGEILLFLLDGPEYITGEIIHLDGGRNLI